MSPLLVANENSRFRSKRDDLNVKRMYFFTICFKRFSLWSNRTNTSTNIIWFVSTSHHCISAYKYCPIDVATQQIHHSVVGHFFFSSCSSCDSTGADTLSPHSFVLSFESHNFVFLIQLSIGSCFCFVICHSHIHAQKYIQRVFHKRKLIEFNTTVSIFQYLSN